jgi:hypothetical protein
MKRVVSQTAALHIAFWQYDRWYRRAWFIWPQAIAILLAVWLLADRGAPACNSGASGLQQQPQPLGSGVVLRFLSPEEAANLLRITEARLGVTINPNYRLDKRAVVRRGVGPAGPTITALVPLGMDVQVGDHVDMQGFQIDPSLPCHYIPNLIARKQ